MNTPTPETNQGLDWTEDFSHENGNYQNQCRDCGELFFGHKRRCWCKKCSHIAPPERNTLDEAAEKYLMKTDHNEDTAIRDAFKAGVEHGTKVQSVKTSDYKKQINELQSALAHQKHLNNAMAKGLMPKELIQPEPPTDINT